MGEGLMVKGLAYKELGTGISCSISFTSLFGICSVCIVESSIVGSAIRKIQSSNVNVNMLHLMPDRVLFPYSIEITFQIQKSFGSLSKTQYLQSAE